MAYHVLNLMVVQKLNKVGKILFKYHRCAGILFFPCVVDTFRATNFNTPNAGVLLRLFNCCLLHENEIVLFYQIVGSSYNLLVFWITASGYMDA